MAGHEPGGVRILGLVGHQGAGKDTFADLLVRDHGFVKMAFADPLRAIVWELNPIILDDAILGGFEDYRTLVEGYGYGEAKRRFSHIRQTFQVLGTDAVRRYLGEDVWADAWERAIAESLRAGKRVVVPDVRFHNEIDRIHELGGVVARVVRPGGEPDRMHASEAAMRSDPGSFYPGAFYPGAFPIYNDGDLARLERRAEEASLLLGQLDPTTAQMMAEAIGGSD